MTTVEYFKIFILSKNPFLQEMLEQIYTDAVIKVFDTENIVIEEFGIKEKSILLSDGVKVSSFISFLMPTILLTNETDITSSIRLNKPFYFTDLTKKINAVKDSFVNIIKVNNKVVINKRAKKLLFIQKDDCKIFELTVKELEILDYIINKKNKAASKSEILENVFGYKDSAHTHTVETHISRIRGKDNSLKDMFVLSGAKYKLKDI